MTQYLITVFKGLTGCKYICMIKAKSNQGPIVVGAESKEEVKEKYRTQVERDITTELGQLFENIGECEK